MLGIPRPYATITGPAYVEQTEYGLSYRACVTESPARVPYAESHAPLIGALLGHSDSAPTERYTHVARVRLRPCGQRGGEGSRTRAAIGASCHRLSVRVSCDGDIQVFWNGRLLLAV